MRWRDLGTHTADAHCIDSRSLRARARTADAVEGVLSFLETRPPTFPSPVSHHMPFFPRVEPVFR